MIKAKWYNPTNNPDWDEYYLVFYIVWGTVFAIILGMIIAMVAV